MLSDETVSIVLHYGHDGELTCTLDADRVVGPHDPPAPVLDPAEATRDGLESPFDGPPLNRSIIDTDQVLLALDPETPQAAAVIAGIVEHLLATGLPAENILILQPPPDDRRQLSDPRSQLASELQDQVRWQIHDPTDEAACAYLATTSGGERVYLARELTEADVVVSVGRAAFDAVLGYRGTSSVLFPGLSNLEASRRSYGQGHTELAPENDRPLRQMIDEIGWLLGTMFTVQVLPAIGGGISMVLAGAVESVHRASCQMLSQHWRVQIPERAATVVVAIDADAAGHGWNQLAAALSAARSLVMQGGRVIVLTELDDELGLGLSMLRGAMEPSDAIKPLRLEKPADVVTATEVAQAVDWASVYLVSHLDPDLVEELFMVPLTEPEQVQRLLQRDGTCVFLHSAQNCYGEIMD